MALKIYPIGIQTFEEIRRLDNLYIDKTEYVYRMTHTDGKYFFLSRPRRFGKSLLISTFKSYFEGKKELFHGLAIEQLEKEWQACPVLHFSMAGGKHMEKEPLERYLLYILEGNEKRFGVECDSKDTNVRMLNLIQTVHRQTGQQVVVLIDEYDAPLLDVVHEEEGLGGHLEMTREETIDQLKQHYDGYHFTWPSPDVFNPYSLLNSPTSATPRHTSKGGGKTVIKVGVNFSVKDEVNTLEWIVG